MANKRLTEIVCGVTRQGRLLILEESNSAITIRGKPVKSLFCRCDCGVEKWISRFCVIYNKQQSCGCLRIEVVSDMMRRKNTKHNQAHTSCQSATYRSWSAMKTRCYNKNSRDYGGWGARGIIVCDRWKKSFLDFYEDMGARPDGMTLDRIDPNGNYEPSNCRWATPKTQINNRRDTRIVELNGIKMPLADACEITGISAILVNNRLRAGFPMEYALTTPKGQMDPSKAMWRPFK